MSLITRKKQQKLEYKTEYFIAMGIWFRRYEEDGIHACRQVAEGEEIPKEYLEDWEGWKPKPLNKLPQSTSSKYSKYYN